MAAFVLINLHPTNVMPTKPARKAGFSMEPQMADEAYWQWYNSAFGAPAAQGPQPGPPQMTPEQIASFYQSVGIPSGQGPTTRPVQSVPMTPPPLPRPVPERATTIATYQTPSVSDYVRGKTLAPVPDRLPTGVAGMPANYGTFTPQQVAQIGVPAGGNTQPPLKVLVDGANPIQTAKIAPIPFQRPTAVGTALDVFPMPPLPIPRPKTAPVPFQRPAFGMGGPAGPAAPMPAPRPGPFGIKLPSLPAMPTFSRPPPMSVSAGAQAVSQSGDTSAGNQFEMANLRASGDSWRAAQEQKKGK